MATQREPKPVFDRVPPQNIEAERSVLGALLINPDSVGTAIEVLGDSPSDLFYVEAHQHIYAATLALFRKNTPIDPVTICDELKAQGTFDAMGGVVYLGDLMSATPTSANVEYHARIVLDAAVRRTLIASCTLIVAMAYEGEGEVADLLDRAESAVFAISQTRQRHPIWRVGDLVTASIEQIERLIKEQSTTRGLPTGLNELDKILSGFQPSDMIVLAARPSVGKTALALNIAAHVAVKERKGVLLFSLEMAKEQLTQRLLCMEGRIDSAKLRSGFLAKDEASKLQPAAARLYDAPLFIDETPNITMLEIRSKARRHMAQNDVQLIIIDYMQLMSGSRRAENRQVEMSEISRHIKGLARELHVPILALSQLSREAEKDDTGRPKLSHLRESGSIEQDADVVIILWRPPKKEEDENAIELIIAKHRNGPTGIVNLLFRKNYQRFEEPTVAGRVDESFVPQDDYGDDETPF